MIKQLRPFYTTAQLGTLYAHSYDHTRWSAHEERIRHTAALVDAYAFTHNLHSVADLSCGDGAIITSGNHLWDTVDMGDLVARPGLTRVGPLETTLHCIAPVDLYLCSETIEHVQDPALVLSVIRQITKHLILTTPHAEWDDGNPEHYWGWDADGIDELLAAAGFKHRKHDLFTPISNDYYTFQIWRAC